MTNERPNILGPVGRFLFSPTDPTTLGFIRILAGLVILYTHAAYTPDLLEFMGPDSWWDHQAAFNQQQRGRLTFPIPLGWERSIYRTVRVDDIPHRRTAEIEFLRSLPADPSIAQGTTPLFEHPNPGNDWCTRADRRSARANEMAFQRAFPRAYNDGLEPRELGCPRIDRRSKSTPEHGSHGRAFQ